MYVYVCSVKGAKERLVSECGLKTYKQLLKVKWLKFALTDRQTDEEKKTETTKGIL